MPRTTRQKIGKRPAPESDADVANKKLAVGLGKNRQFEISGRPAFGAAAKKMNVNQDSSAGPTEDRRHILHYDEVLKPLVERVVTRLYQETGFDNVKVGQLVSQAMQKKGLARLPTTPEKLLERLVTAINGATENLVPDRADTNKAIEVVRGYIRGYIQALSTEQFADDARDSNGARMAAYRSEARKFFLLDGSGSEINAERNRIHGEILAMVDGCASPAELWALLHDLVYSVTFDFSPKITRDATVRALAWQKTMRSNADEPGSKQLEDLLAILG
jgi:hypothetical protein